MVRLKRLGSKLMIEPSAGANNQNQFIYTRVFVANTV